MSGEDTWVGLVQVCPVCQWSDGSHNSRCPVFPLLAALAQAEREREDLGRQAMKWRDERDAARAEAERLKAELTAVAAALGYPIESLSAPCAVLAHAVTTLAQNFSRAEAALVRVRAAAWDHLYWLNGQHESCERIGTAMALRAALEGR